MTKFSDFLKRRQTRADERKANADARRGVSHNKYDPPQCRGYRQERPYIEMGMSARPFRRTSRRRPMPRPARTNALYLAQFPKDATR